MRPKCEVLRGCLVREHCCDGKPAAQTFRACHDVWCDVVMLVPEQATRAPHPSLHFIDD